MVQFVIPVVASAPLRYEVTSAVIAGSSMAYHWYKNDKQGVGLNYEITVSPTLTLALLNFIRDVYFPDKGIIDSNVNLNVKKNPLGSDTGYETNINGQMSLIDSLGNVQIIDINETISSLIALKTDNLLGDLMIDLSKPEFNEEYISGVELKQRLESNELVPAGYEISVPYDPADTIFVPNPALPADYAGKDGVIIRDKDFIDSLINGNSLLKNPAFPLPLGIPKESDIPDHIAQELINGGIIAPPISGEITSPKIKVFPDEIPAIIDTPHFRLRIKDLFSTTSLLKPKEILKVEDLSVATVEALSAIGKSHDDCIEYTSSEYDKAYSLYATQLAFYNSKKATYDEIAARNGAGYGDINNWYADLRTAEMWVNVATTRLNETIPAVNYWNDLRIKCETDQRNDAIALLDSLIDTCLPCSEIKKIIIATFGDITTDSFDSICEEHDEARKVLTNCCLKAMCDPCNYKYIKGV